MSDLDPNSYWQRKATYQNLSKAIPDFKKIKPGETFKYYDDDGDLHFEVKAYNSNITKSQFGGVIDYMQGEITAKPFPQIVQEIPLKQVSMYIIATVLDAYARLTFDRGLNEMLNTYDRVDLIDHKTGETHQFEGSLANDQLAFRISYKTDSDFKVSRQGNLKYKEGENYSRDFKSFLKKIGPDFRDRFPDTELYRGT